MKKYTAPEMEMNELRTLDVITMSSVKGDAADVKSVTVSLGDDFYD